LIILTLGEYTIRNSTMAMIGAEKSGMIWFVYHAILVKNVRKAVIIIK
jgi:hypothetical protein